MSAEYIEAILVIVLIVVILLAMFMNNKRDAVLVGTTITNIAAIVMYIWLSKKYDALDEKIEGMTKDTETTTGGAGKETFIGTAYGTGVEYGGQPPTANPSGAEYGIEMTRDDQCPAGGAGQYPGEGMQYPGAIEMQCPTASPDGADIRQFGGSQIGYAGAVDVSGAACDVDDNQYNVYDVASNVPTGDEKIAKYGLTRERNTRAISGSVERVNLMAQFLIGETDEEEKKRWWGEDEQ